MRQMVQIDVNKPLMLVCKRGEIRVRKVIASRGSIITDVSILGETRDGQPGSCTYILADAPSEIRDMVNSAFKVAFDQE